MEELRYGMEGYAVKLLQYALGRAGLDAGNPDGIFGRRTARALLRFQRDRGLSSDGAAGRLTWAALYPYLAGYTLHRVRPGDPMPEAAVGETATVPLDLPVVADGMPWSYLMHGLAVKGLAMRYPFLKVQEIGRSVMGRPILALSMGGGQRQVACAGPHRGDQWAAAAALLRFVESYADAHIRGGTIGGISAKRAFEETTLHMVPLVNPDGTDLVTGALSSLDSFYGQAQALAAYYPDVPFPIGWRSNISGVDLSLQYPGGWDAKRKSSYRTGYTRPGPLGYVGGEPLIAPEVRALARWTREHGFSLILAFDEGYRDWFSGTWGRPALALEAGKAWRCEDIYAKNLPPMAQRLLFSP